MSVRLPGQMPRVPESVDRWLRRTSFALLVLLALALLSHKVFNSDIWWHVKTGERILAGDGIPHVDPYAYTAEGRAWIDMHWGFQVLAGLAFRLGGGAGLNLLMLVIVGTALAITARNQYDRSYWSFSAVFLLILLLGTNTRFLVRPEMFTFLFLAIATWLLLHVGDERWGPWFWALPILVAAWANMQGLFILGIVLIVLAAAGETLRRTMLVGLAWAPEPLLARHWIRLRTVPVLAVLAALLTPYTWRGLLFPFTLFTRVGGGQNVFSEVIAEFQPPFGAGPLSAPIETFAVFIVLTLAVLVVNSRHLPAYVWFVVPAFLFLGLTARRNVPVAMFVLTPLAVASANAVLRRAERRTLWDLVGLRTWVQAGLGVVVCLMSAWHIVHVLTDSYYLEDRRGERFGLGVAENIYPGPAVDFVIRHDLPGPLFNSMYAGGYLIYRLAPELHKVSLDSRLEVHTAATISRYVAAARGPAELQGLLNMYGARTAVITHNSQDVGTLFTSFILLPDWHLVHLDATGAVFVESAVARAWDLPIVRLPVRATTWPEPVSAGFESVTPAWARALQRAVGALRLGPRFPAELFNMANLYVQLRLPEAAIPLYHEGLRRFPRTAHGWYNLGVAYYNVLQLDAAEDAFHEAIALHPQYSAAWNSLGQIADARALRAEARGEETGAHLLHAVEAYHRAVRVDGRNEAARYNLADTLANAGDYARAYAHFRKLVMEHRGPVPAEWWYKYGRACWNVGRFDEGADALQRAVEAKPDEARYWIGLSDFLFAVDDVGGARGALRRAFELDPTNPEVRRRLRALNTGVAP